MDIFLDTSSVTDLQAALQTGLVKGVTTNPALLAKDPEISADKLKEIATLVKGPVSIQVLSENAEEMLVQAQRIASFAPNVVVKIPMGLEGLRATKALAAKDIKTNVTLCFSAFHGLLAAQAGATYVSPFMGRLEDTGGNGFKLLQDIRHLYTTYGCKTKILAASVRTQQHVEQAALAGADAATLPIKVFKNLLKNDNIDRGLADITCHYGMLQAKYLA